jgi:hypothetical protein
MNNTTDALTQAQEARLLWLSATLGPLDQSLIRSAWAGDVKAIKRLCHSDSKDMRAFLSMAVSKQACTMNAFGMFLITAWKSNKSGLISAVKKTREVRHMFRRAGLDVPDELAV